MSFGNKVFTSAWERVFQIFFPGGFLTIEFGWYFVLGAFVLTSAIFLLQIKYLDNKLIIRKIILNFCILAVSMFIPALLGVCIVILLCNPIISLKNNDELPKTIKIPIIVLSVIGLLGLVGVCGIFIFFWRFLFAFMLLGGFVVGLLILIIPYIRILTSDILENVSPKRLKQIGLISGLLF